MTVSFIIHLFASQLKSLYRSWWVRKVISHGGWITVLWGCRICISNIGVSFFLSSFCVFTFNVDVTNAARTAPVYLFMHRGSYRRTHLRDQPIVSIKRTFWTQFWQPLLVSNMSQCEHALTHFNVNKWTHLTFVYKCCRLLLTKCT